MSLSPRPDTKRRLFDIALATLGLIGLSPLLIVVAISIMAYDRGPILYRARRVGKGGKIIHVYKFRTMRRDAGMDGPGITRVGDRRVTGIGRVLRRMKIDELPQLINVVKGEMSIVGPRPEDPRYVAIYTPEQRRVLAATPGITSAASIKFRSEENLLTGDDWEKLYREKILPEKIAIDLAYLERRNIREDLRIVMQTISALKS
jgi:lipopolysaccharide/colanic/teichoic acid biosynthesis glycosyltransferase